MSKCNYSMVIRNDSFFYSTACYCFLDTYFQATKVVPWKQQFQDSYFVHWENYLAKKLFSHMFQPLSSSKWELSNETTICYPAVWILRLLKAQKMHSPGPFSLSRKLNFALLSWKLSWLSLSHLNFALLSRKLSWLSLSH